MLKLGQLDLTSPFVLAPMESVSDCAYRRVCWDRGASLTWTEMIRARGLARKNKSTFDLIDTFDPEVLTGVQLMVANERELTEALEAIEGSTAAHFKNIRAVDLNFGCPSPEVIRIGAGPALLKRKGKLDAIFSTLAEWKRRTTLPIGAVGAKIRLGLNRMEQDQKVYLPIVELANEHLDYLVVHARHARQDSTEKPTWSAIAEVHARAKIPIIGNGDVVTKADWDRLHAETGAEGALIARGAIRSPFVFRGLRGLGSGAPVDAGEIDAAEQQYVALAAKWGSKPKFREWHAEGFRRMRARLAGQPEKGPALPQNEHMK
ncbi:MAG: tRNA-dihydrouridine synthase family protein [Myxococcaceae bacterium]